MFGKLNNGKLEKFNGFFLIKGESVIANPRDTDLLDAGFKEIQETDLPEHTEYQYIETGYTELNGKIVEVHTVQDKEVHEQEYPSDIPVGYHIERYENIREKDIYITYEIVPDELEVEVEVGDINATTNNDNVELDIETQVGETDNSGDN